jgi:hypothetical protein
MTIPLSTAEMHFERRAARMAVGLTQKGNGIISDDDSTVPTSTSTLSQQACEDHKFPLYEQQKGHSWQMRRSQSQISSTALKKLP